MNNLLRSSHVNIVYTTQYQKTLHQGRASESVLHTTLPILRPLIQIKKSFPHNGSNYVNCELNGKK